MGTRASMSPAPAAFVASSRSSTGRSTDLVISTVSSSEIVNATSTATTTSSPRSVSEAVPSVERPLTTTPVITFTIGSAPSSFHRSGTPARTAGKSPGRCAGQVGRARGA